MCVRLRIGLKLHWGAFTEYLPVICPIWPLLEHALVGHPAPSFAPIFPAAFPFLLPLLPNSNAHDKFQTLFQEAVSQPLPVCRRVIEFYSLLSRTSSKKWALFPWLMSWVWEFLWALRKSSRVLHQQQCRLPSRSGFSLCSQWWTGA